MGLNKMPGTLLVCAALCAPAAAGEQVAVLHNTAAGQQLADDVKEYVDGMTEALDAAGITYAVLSDREVSRKGLAGFRFAILPYNPRMPETVDAIVAGFIASGGKVLLFYERPTQTFAALGFEPVRWIETRDTKETEAVRFKKGVLPGAADFKQPSWNIWIVKPGKEGKVAAEWLDVNGKPTGHPAVVVSPAGLYMSHVLFAPDLKKRAAFVKAALDWLGKQKLPQTDIAVWRNTHAERTDRTGDGAAVGRYLQNVRNVLDLTGIPYQVISDEAVLAGALQRFKLVILPLNPSIPRAAVRKAEQFVKNGGKLFVFYSYPSAIGRLLGISSTGLKREPGMYHKVRVDADAFAEEARPVLLGASFIQNSYHCLGARLSGGAVIGGRWISRKGARSEHPALVVSKNGLYMSHCMLAGDESAKARLLTGVAVHFLGQRVCAAPAGWEAELTRLGRAASASLGPLGQDPGPHVRIVRALEPVVRATEAAKRAEREGRLVESWMRRTEARAAAERAYCLAQPTREVEGRGVWLHSPKYENWDDVFKKLAAGGINQIFPNLCSPAYADYKSDLLPPSQVFKERGDQLAQMLAAGVKHGIDVHVWMVNFYCMRASKELMQRLLRDERLTLGRDGTRPKGQAFLCPSDPRNRKLIADVMVEITKNYHPAGIHFDYIRYHGGGECFCPRCRRQFEELLGRKLQDWGELDRDPKLAAKWADFRCDNITTVVADVAKRSRAIDPRVKISAAVFSHYPQCRHGVGQDWKLWIEKGYLDFVCPMNYTTDAKNFDGMTREQMRFVGKRVPVYPGIGSFRLPAAWRVVEQVRLAREAGSAGVTFFELNDVFLERFLPVLGSGPFRSRAVPPHRK